MARLKPTDQTHYHFMGDAKPCIVQYFVGKKFKIKEVVVTYWQVVDERGQPILNTYGNPNYAAKEDAEGELRLAVEYQNKIKKELQRSSDMPMTAADLFKKRE